jgi:hypothetical protein
MVSSDRFLPLSEALAEGRDVKPATETPHMRTASTTAIRVVGMDMAMRS